MKAIVISKTGDAGVLAWRDCPTPEAGPGEVLIRVKAAGLNRSDVLLRQGSYGESDAVGRIPGLEVAGLVEACGPDVRRWKRGDAVCALIRSGGYAEYVTVDERLCLPVPAGYSFEEAAGLPETVFTVWYNVFQKGELRPGEHFLVHGGSSGIGITAIQLASAFGAKAFATAGSAEKCVFCEQLGAVRCVNYQTDDFEKVLKEYGMDVILDMVGGDYTSRNIRLLNPEGRLMFINAMKGAKTEINALEVMNKRLLISGSTLRPRTVDFKAALAAEVEKNVWPLLGEGRFQTVVHQVFPLEKAAEAQQLLESSRHIGKLILTIA